MLKFAVAISDVIVCVNNVGVGRLPSVLLFLATSCGITGEVVVVDMFGVAIFLDQVLDDMFPQICLPAIMQRHISELTTATNHRSN